MMVWLNTSVALRRFFVGIGVGGSSFLKKKVPIRNRPELPIAVLGDEVNLIGFRPFG